MFTNGERRLLLDVLSRVSDRLTMEAYGENGSERPPEILQEITIDQRTEVDEIHSTIFYKLDHLSEKQRDIIKSILSDIKVAPSDRIAVKSILMKLEYR